MTAIRAATAVLLLALAGCAAATPATTRATTPAAPEPYRCLLSGETRMLVAELFFGRTIPGRGPLSDNEWARFVAEVVTPNFPGFTVFDGAGQWRNPESRQIVRERTKVLLVAVPRGAELAGRLAAVIDAYKARFRQSSVGVITRDSCAAF